MGCSGSTSAQAQFHEEYKLGPVIGEGAFSQVRQARKQSPVVLFGRTRGEEPQETLAVKILDAKGGGMGSWLKGGRTKRALAKREVEMLRLVGRHSHVVSLKDSFFGSDSCFLVMERCALSMSEALQGRAFNEADVAHAFREMLLGIDYVHIHRVVHRDVKPDNFLLGGPSGRRVMLADFGLAAPLPPCEKLTRVLGTSPSQLPGGLLTGVFGTVPYMAPEMLKGAWYDGSVDIWSFGITAYVMLFGSYAYGPAPNCIETKAEEIKISIRSDHPRPTFEPAEGGREVSEKARSFVQQVLIRNPKARFSSHACLSRALMREAAKNARGGASGQADARAFFFQGEVSS